jgi:hypothetical protein
MPIIGCDFQVRYQQIATVKEKAAKLLVERRLNRCGVKIFSVGANRTRKIIKAVLPVGLY